MIAAGAAGAAGAALPDISLLAGKPKLSDPCVTPKCFIPQYD